MGYVRCLRYVLPIMVKQGGGRVVNLIGNDGVKPSYWEICPGAANAAPPPASIERVVTEQAEHVELALGEAGEARRREVRDAEPEHVLRHVAGVVHDGRLHVLPDELRLLFVGINPGLWTAAVQTHFAHPGNRQGGTNGDGNSRVGIPGCRPAPQRLIRPSRTNAASRRGSSSATAAICASRLGQVASSKSSSALASAIAQALGVTASGGQPVREALEARLPLRSVAGDIEVQLPAVAGARRTGHAELLQRVHAEAVEGQDRLRAIRARAPARS